MLPLQCTLKDGTAAVIERTAGEVRLHNEAAGCSPVQMHLVPRPASVLRHSGISGCTICERCDGSLGLGMNAIHHADSTAHTSLPSCTNSTWMPLRNCRKHTVHTQAHSRLRGYGVLGEGRVDKNQATGWAICGMGDTGALMV